MDQVWALIVKYIGITLAVLLALFITGLSAGYGSLFLATAFLTGVAYVVGDLLVLPAGGNLVAVVADMGLAAGTLWVEATISAAITVTPLFLVVATVLIGLFEYVFHAYLLDQGVVEPNV